MPADRPPARAVIRRPDLDAELRIEPARGGAGPSGVLLRADQVVLRSDAPVRITVAYGDSLAHHARELAVGYTAARPAGAGLLARAQAGLAGVTFLIEDHYSWESEQITAVDSQSYALRIDRGVLLRLRRRVTLSVPGAGAGPAAASGRESAPSAGDPVPAGFASGFGWTPSRVAEPAWFLPGCVYGRNQDAPPGAIGAAIGREPVFVREDRLALPLAARYDPDTRAAVCLFHDGASGQTVQADDFASVVVSERLGFGSFGDLSADDLGFSYPGREGAVSYPPMWAAGLGNSQADSPVNPFSFPAPYRPRQWALRYHPVRDGFTHDYELITVVTGAASFTGFLREAWRVAWSLADPRPRPAEPAAVEQVSLDLLAASVISDPPGEPGGRATDGPIGIPTWIDVFTGRPGRLQDTFSAGFVGRNLEVADVLLRAAAGPGRAEGDRLGRAIIDFWVRRSGAGLCHTEWDRKRRAWTDTDHDQRTWTDAGPAGGVVYLRDQSEARNAVLSAAAWMRSRGRDRPGWLAWCESYGRWLADHVRADGSLCRSYRLDGTPADAAANDGVHAAGFLARLALVTGDRTWLALAERIGDFCWSNFHAAGRFFGGSLDNPNCCDREAASLALDAYLALHDAAGAPDHAPGARDGTTGARDETTGARDDAGCATAAAAAVGGAGAPNAASGPMNVAAGRFNVPQSHIHPHDRAGAVGGGGVSGGGGIAGAVGGGGAGAGGVGGGGGGVSGGEVSGGGAGRWLSRAQLAADFCETWIIGWDLPMTAADQSEHRFFDPAASAAGLSLITLGFSAVDTYLSGQVGDFLRLADLTGDDHYAAVARLLLRGGKHMVQVAGEYGYAAPGYQIEHWAVGRGRGYGLNSGGLPWVSTSHVRGIWAARDYGMA
ncbi:MAG TPA: hypothetical protein VHY31_24580 [Streptosporangiaceae bacterium]|nr:hypothetical protein [Streptosporangiaceae bacterium]